MAQKGLQIVREAVASGDYQLIILDEINVALDYHLVNLEEVIQLIKEKPPELNLVLTGRGAAPEIIQLADLVSVVEEVKHHYRNGVKARAGIEF